MRYKDLTIFNWYRGQPSLDGEHALPIFSDGKAFLHRLYWDYFLRRSAALKLTKYQTLYKSKIMSDSKT
jgi:hypothetical protein